MVSKLSNLEDDPSVLALGKLEYQKYTEKVYGLITFIYFFTLRVVWSLLIQGLLIAWNPLTRERELTVSRIVNVYYVVLEHITDITTS